MCGVPAQDQLLHVVTQEGNRPLQDGTKLPDYFPDVRNRCELVMVDSVPDRDVKKAKQGEAGGKKSMGADSVLSMARMFQAVRHRLLHITLTPSLYIERREMQRERERDGAGCSGNVACLLRAGLDPDHASVRCWCGCRHRDMCQGHRSATCRKTAS
jgi:hypothetical protein